MSERYEEEEVPSWLTSKVVQTKEECDDKTRLLCRDGCCVKWVVNGRKEVNCNCEGHRYLYFC